MAKLQLGYHNTHKKAHLCVGGHDPGDKRGGAVERARDVPRLRGESHPQEKGGDQGCHQQSRLYWREEGGDRIALVLRNGRGSLVR